MSFKLTHPLPEKCAVAVSGGVDSLSALHFLSQVEGRVHHVVHVNHASGEFADLAEEFVMGYCDKAKIPVSSYKSGVEADPGESQEKHWRDVRYKFLNQDYESHGMPIVLGHNMDDCLEEYIICTMVRGFSGTIPYQHGPCIRPFRLWRRRDIQLYASDNKLQALQDPSNQDYTHFMRAKIRMHVRPKIVNLNPGVYNIIEKVIREQDERDESRKK